MQKQKYYVVWNGVNPGIYSSWKECKEQVAQFKGAMYKAFESLEEAQQAFDSPPFLYLRKERVEKAKMVADHVQYDPVSLTVDAACSGNPGQMEYQGVYCDTRDRVFHFGPILGTNNIGEFLAIVHALALLKQKNLSIPIYTDSRTAMSWVRKKKCNSQLERNEKTAKVWELVDRAEKWLAENHYTTEIRKWETDLWGEIPADFGRKG